jgi:hypothetical protein
VSICVYLWLKHYQSGGRYESQGIGKKAVPQLQGSAAQGRGSDYLLRPATQTTPGLIG